MKITQTQKTKKFSFSAVSYQEMIEMHNALSSNSELKDLIKQALYESVDEDEILEEYSCSIAEYWANVGMD